MIYYLLLILLCLGLFAPKITFSAFVVLTIGVCFFKGKLAVVQKIGADEIILFLFGLSYVLIGNFTIENILLYVLLPVLFYACGKIIINEEEKCVDKIVFALICGFGLHLAFNYFSNLNSDSVLKRTVVDFFTKDVQSATGAASLTLIPISLLIYLLFDIKNKKSIFGFAAIILSVLYCVLIGTRTQLNILFILFIAFLLFYAFNSKLKKRNEHILLIAAVAIGGFFLAYVFNMFGLKTFFDNSMLSYRFESTNTYLSDDERFAMIGDGFISLFENPFGGLKNSRYFHNMWLDIGRVSGVVPLFFMILFNISSLKKSYKIVRDKNIEIKYRGLVLGLVLGFLLNFFVEPILEGELLLFMLYCMFSGMLSVYLDRKSMAKCESVRN